MRLRSLGLIPENPDVLFQEPYPGQVGMQFWPPRIENDQILEDPRLYSVRLEALVQNCLQVSINDRPALDDVGRHIDQALVDWGKRIPGLAELTFDELPKFMRVDCGLDLYPLDPEAKKQRFGEEG